MSHNYFWIRRHGTWPAERDVLEKADRLSAAAIEFDAALRSPRDLPRVQKAAEAFGLALKKYEEIRGREWIPPVDRWFD